MASTNYRPGDRVVFRKGGGEIRRAEVISVSPTGQRYSVWVEGYAKPVDFLARTDHRVGASPFCGSYISGRWEDKHEAELAAQVDDVKRIAIRNSLSDLDHNNITLADAEAYVEFLRGRILLNVLGAS